MNHKKLRPYTDEDRKKGVAKAKEVNNARKNLSDMINTSSSELQKKWNKSLAKLDDMNKTALYVYVTRIISKNKEAFFQAIVDTATGYYYKDEKSQRIYTKPPDRIAQQILINILNTNMFDKYKGKEKEIKQSFEEHLNEEE